MPFEGSCHCGTVTFSVDADLPESAMSCNCSHCRRKGLLLAFFPAAAFTVNSGDGALTGYTFNTHRINHHICKICGTQPFGQGNRPDGTEMPAVNLRCVQSINLETLKLNHFDGASA